MLLDKDAQSHIFIELEKHFLLLGIATFHVWIIKNSFHLHSEIKNWYGQWTGWQENNNSACKFIPSGICWWREGGSCRLSTFVERNITPPFALLCHQFPDKKTIITKENWNWKLHYHIKRLRLQGFLSTYAETDKEICNFLILNFWSSFCICKRTNRNYFSLIQLIFCLLLS